MITLDFSNLHEPKCKGYNTPGVADSDFELWSPHDDGRHGSNNKCFLGQQVTYVRRKQDAECFNGEDFERQTMRVPCLCTDADYECDMNYVRNKGGKCEAIQDPANHSKALTEKEEDCALEGFYMVTQGYRKIPGNMCYGGTLDPYRKPCTSFAWLSSIISLRAAAVIAIIGAAIYYGWPIIEAIILILPIPDPKDFINKIKSMVSGFVTDSRRTGPNGGGGSGEYSSNLGAGPSAFMGAGGDDSDDDLGKPAAMSDDDDEKAGGLGLDYDSDDKNEDEVTVNAGSSELIDLGGDDDAEIAVKPKAAAKIPKLSKHN
jgi:hypothetical protein